MHTYLLQLMAKKDTNISIRPSKKNENLKQQLIKIVEKKNIEVKDREKKWSLNELCISVLEKFAIEQTAGLN